MRGWGAALSLSKQSRPLPRALGASCHLPPPTAPRSFSRGCPRCHLFLPFSPCGDALQQPACRALCPRSSRSALGIFPVGADGSGAQGWAGVCVKIPGHVRRDLHSNSGAGARLPSSLEEAEFIR